jgi:hypothetical protein
MQTNRRAAEAMGLELFDALKPAQQRAILESHDDVGGERIRVSTRSSTRRALEGAELVEPGARYFTPWGLFVFRVALSRHRSRIAIAAATHRARRGNPTGEDRLMSA